MNILTISLSKTFSDTRVMKYIQWYLNNSYKVYAIGLDEFWNSTIKNNKNFKYAKIENILEKKNISNYKFFKFVKTNFLISILIIISLNLISISLNLISISLENLKYYQFKDMFNYIEYLFNSFLSISIAINFLIVFIIISLLRFGYEIFKNIDKILLNFNNLLLFIKRFRLFYLNFKSLINKKKNINFKIIHLHDLWTIIFIPILKKKYPDSKIILDLHEIYEEVPSQTIQYKIRCKFFIIILKLFKKKIDQYITINDYIKNFYETKHKLTPMLIINNSCDFSKNIIFSGTNKTYETLIKLREENKKILIYQGGLSNFRGIIEVCNFFKYYNPKNWILFIIGNGKLESAINIIIDQNEKKNIYRFDSVNLNDLSYYTKKADLGLINYENNCLNHNYCNPNKLWEYSSCGIPMILSNCKSFIDLNHKYNFAKIIYDTKQLNSSLLEILEELNNNDQLKLLSKNAKEFYNKNSYKIEQEKFNNFLSVFTRSV